MTKKLNLAMGFFFIFFAMVGFLLPEKGPWITWLPLILPYNLIHLATGILLLAISFFSERVNLWTAILFGGIYGVLSFLGLIRLHHFSVILTTPWLEVIHLFAAAIALNLGIQAIQEHTTETEPKTDKTSKSA